MCLVIIGRPSLLKNLLRSNAMPITKLSYKKYYNTGNSYSHILRTIFSGQVKSPQVHNTCTSKVTIFPGKSHITKTIFGGLKLTKIHVYMPLRYARAICL